jgi:hypothetical protein
MATSTHSHPDRPAKPDVAGQVEALIREILPKHRCSIEQVVSISPWIAEHYRGD